METDASLVPPPEVGAAEMEDNTTGASVESSIAKMHDDLSEINNSPEVGEPENNLLNDVGKSEDTDKAKSGDIVEGGISALESTLEDKVEENALLEDAPSIAATSSSSSAGAIKEKSPDDNNTGDLCESSAILGDVSSPIDSGEVESPKNMDETIKGTKETALIDDSISKDHEESQEKNINPDESQEEINPDESQEEMHLDKSRERDINLDENQEKEMDLDENQEKEINPDEQDKELNNMDEKEKDSDSMNVSEISNELDDTPSLADKEKPDTNNQTIEYVNMDHEMDDEGGSGPKDSSRGDEIIEGEDNLAENNDSVMVTEDVNPLGDDKELPKDTDELTSNSIENIEMTEEDHLDGDKEASSKDDACEPMDEDPIASDVFIPEPENQEGADEELCIIPDTERVISQAEKEAAVSIPPLRDLTEASTSIEATESTDGPVIPEPAVTPPGDKFIISKCLSTDEELQTCVQCLLLRKAKYTVKKDDKTEYICHDTCLDNFKTGNADKYILNWECEIRVKDLTAPKEPAAPKVHVYERKCVVCSKKTDDEENNLTWEIMDFCGELCLSKYQQEIGSNCTSCSQEVRSNSLGKYCVRFGNDIRQFCSGHCLEDYKKGLKVCSYCQRDMSSETDGFLAPVGDKGQFKDFCSQKCMEKYDIMTNNRPPVVEEGTKCSVCKGDNAITIEYDADSSSPHFFCGERCFVAFSFVNNITPAKCSMCRRYFPHDVLEKNTMFYDNVQYSFCSNSCQNIYIIAHRKIVPCVWCKVKKYNFDMIRRYFKTGPVLNMCSINCLSLFQVSVNAVSSKKTACNFCNKRHQPMYHLTMSDATIRNFCSYGCVMSFQNKFKKSPITLNNQDNGGEEPPNYPVPTGEPKKNRKYDANETNAGAIPASTLPVISSVQSLATAKNGTFTPPSQNSTPTRGTRNSGTGGTPKANNITINNSAQHVEPQVVTKIKHHIIIKPSPVPNQRNVATMCKVRVHHKSTTMKPIMVEKGIQTDESEAKKIIIPVPIPIYVPSPLPMYSIPVPYPMPFPVPIPVPIFIPTTRNSAKGIMKEIKKIQVKIPTDPYEAELLMMAEMVAGDKKEENTDSESDVDDAGGADEGGGFSPEPVDASNTFGDDMLQMALKMATELDEPAVDLEGALTANTITAAPGAEGPNSEENVDDPQPLMQHMGERQGFRGGRKRGRGAGRGGPGAKRRRTSSHHQQQPAMEMAPVMAPQQPPPPAEPTEKPDAHLCLKYTFGVNAWKQWVSTKNADLEKQTKFVKPFKTEILQLTADELNFSLCLFVKEVRKPNGAEYAPDTIYYLCLGIQQYLFENNRIDNIFCDPYYEQFTDSLDEVARKFSVLYNDSHYIVTRVEEEHLWESKQLGAHSPFVLLSTLMFFNTKHFNLTTVQEHMQLSFSHIMKHWKRNPNQAGVTRVPGSRNVLLRFYPPQNALQNNTRKKKVYEQQENEENPLRCPVKLYEFYLSKCPESVKTRNDVFYLQPERSCVPDSPVWYSTSALPQDALEKMLHRVKMVKEINVALLTS